MCWIAWYFALLFSLNNLNRHHQKVAQEATANWRFWVFTRPLAASVEHETAELMLEAPMDAMDAMDNRGDRPWWLTGILMQLTIHKILKFASIKGRQVKFKTFFAESHIVMCNALNNREKKTELKVPAVCMNGSHIKSPCGRLHGSLFELERAGWKRRMLSTCIHHLRHYIQ